MANGKREAGRDRTLSSCKQHSISIIQQVQTKHLQARLRKTSRYWKGLAKIVGSDTLSPPEARDSLTGRPCRNRPPPHRTRPPPLPWRPGTADTLKQGRS